MHRNHHGTRQPEISDISQSILLLMVRQAKMNGHIKSLVKINKENNAELQRLRKEIKELKIK